MLDVLRQATGYRVLKKTCMVLHMIALHVCHTEITGSVTINIGLGANLYSSNVSY